ncbi:ABC transporter permease [Vallitalea guaymasensis]|uniref:ABC transporter permease n=1 Tax=Vallitalea guaymasensis TaxID=1185412 RepID=UPI00272D5D39|nr:ABC transporter permease [Vallitalea guaymasensis]
MISIKLALKNILRIKGRSIMIGIILLVISISVLVSLSIQSGTKETLLEVRQELGNDITLEVNMQNMQKKMIENMQNGGSTKIDIETLTTDIAEQYTESKYIKDYDYSIEVALITDNKVIGENDGESNVSIMNNSEGNSEKGSMTFPEIKLIGNLNSEYQKEFRNGNKTIVDGRLYTKEEVEKKEPVAVISKNLAELNNLKVGDTFTAKTIDEDEKEVNLKIIGLYEDSVQQDISIPFPYMYRNNEIYTPLTIADSLRGGTDTKESIINSATYIIDDPVNISAFKEEVKASGLDLENFVLDANDESYTKMVGPLEKLNSIIRLFLIIVVITGAIIMVLLMTITTRERKLEVGILRSLGVKRGRIALQFITETLIIVSFALVIGIMAGKTVSQKTADYLLQKEVTAQKEADEENNDNLTNIMIMNDTSTDNAQVEAIDKIETRVEIKEILYLILIALFISSCGSVVSSFWIMKYEPMKILSNRV